MLVHQRYQGGSWHLLGRFTNPQQVLLTDKAISGLIIADAVMALPVALDSALYIDDNDAALEGTWKSSHNVSGYYQDGYQYTKTGKASYFIPINQDDDYHVFARWAAGTDRTPQAPPRGSARRSD